MCFIDGFSCISPPRTHRLLFLMLVFLGMRKPHLPFSNYQIDYNNLNKLQHNLVSL